jgi:hypothetical protein
MDLWRSTLASYLQEKMDSVFKSSFFCTNICDGMFAASSFYIFVFRENVLTFTVVLFLKWILDNVII